MDSKKKGLDLKTEIAKLRERLGLSQDSFAKRIGVSRPAVSAWEVGRAVPPPANLVQLVEMADSAEVRMFFIHQAGLDDQTIIRAAEAILQKQVAPLSPGEAVRVPRFRDPGATIKSKNGDVPLPAEFVPNPSATICVEIDEDSPNVFGPRGLFILDKSSEALQDLGAICGHEVMLQYLPDDEPKSPVRGLHTGRLRVGSSFGSPSPEISVHMHLDVKVSWGNGALDVCQPYIKMDEPRGMSEEDQFARRARVREVQAKALGALRLKPGVTILGEIIGHLTGHMEHQARGQAKP